MCKCLKTASATPHSKPYDFALRAARLLVAGLVIVTVTSRMLLVAKDNNMWSQSNNKSTEAKITRAYFGLDVHIYYSESSMYVCIYIYIYICKMGESRQKHF